jgi:hypothetical protein
MDVLTEFRDRYRTRFTNAINVDLHSAGGWSPEFWVQAEVSERPEYFSIRRRMKSTLFLCQGHSLPESFGPSPSPSPRF